MIPQQHKMNTRTFRLALFISAACLTMSCQDISANTINDNIPSDKPTETSTLFPTSISGTKIKESATVAGMIKDSRTGKGIAGVPVSDGYNFVTTDANGVYQMKADKRARKIYYTTPAEYKIALDGKKHQPCFYSEGLLQHDRKLRIDFNLTLLDAPEKEFTLVMIGDPQCYKTSQVKRYTGETVADIVRTAGECPNCYAITLGDITFDSSNMWKEMSASMSNVEAAGGYVPFFQCIGNHDHDSLSPDTADNEDDDHMATCSFVETFGPTDYSFDRGDVHIIVLDDICVTSIKGSSRPNGATWSYVGGFTDDQLKWLKQDIALVDDPASKAVVVCAHIPFRSGSNETGSSVSSSRHYDDVLRLLTQFRECHIMIGHTHYNQNYIHTSRLCAGGQPIYEHIHGGACGAWWSADCTTTGAPNGYNVYKFDGPGVKDWWLKGSNKQKEYQLRVFDGDKVYSGSKNYEYLWYRPSNTYAECTAKGFEEARGALVAEVFDDDSKNWRVEFWQGGVKKGDFIRAAAGGISNIPLAAFWYNEKNMTSTNYVNTTASHYWYYKPADGTAPADLKDWEVRAVFTVPTNPSQVNVYKCTRLTTDNSEYDK